MKIKNERVLAKWQQLLVFALILVLPVSAVMVAVVRSNYWNTDTTPHAAQKVNMQVFDSASKLINDEIEKVSLSRDIDVDELNRASVLQKKLDQVIQSDDYDIDSLISYMFSVLNQDELDLVVALFDDLSKEKQDSFLATQSQDLSRGNVRLWIYAHFSTGWFVGGVVSSLITIALVGVVAQLAGMGFAAGAVIGLVIGALIGATIGAALVAAIDNLVYRGGQAGFTRTLIEKNWSIWLVKANVEWNILDIFFELIDFAGGGFISGSSKPIGSPMFSWA